MEAFLMECLQTRRRVTFRGFANGQKRGKMEKVYSTLEFKSGASLRVIGKKLQPNEMVFLLFEMALSRESASNLPLILSR